MDLPKPPRRWHDGDRFALFVGAVYGALGVAWILGSDALVEAISSDPEWLRQAQRYKGLVYVWLTALALVLLVRVGYRQLLAARERARQSDLRVQDLFMQHPMPMWVFDLGNYRFLRVNDAALAAYGYTRAEFEAMTALDIRPPEEAAAFLSAVRARRDEPRSPGVFRHRTKAGAVIDVRITEHVLELDGRPAMMVMAENVTDETRLQRRMQRQQEEFRQLHDSLEEVLWMSTPEGDRLHYVSPAFATLYGHAPADLMARPALWLEVIHPDDRSGALASVPLATDADISVARYRIVRPDGSLRWVEDRKQLIRDEHGQVVMRGGIAKDITPLIEHERALEQLNEQLEHEVQVRTQALADANVELEAFSRTAAHDLRSPLNGIVGMGQLLRLKHADQLDDTGRGYVDQIERSARDMSTLIDDLLKLSRAGSVPLDCRWVDLAPVIDAVVSELKAGHPQRDVAVSRPERVEAFCDPGLMRSVLQNLIGNAWKFSAQRADARVAVRVVCEDTASCIEVQDNGAGFDSSAAAAGFRPFERFHTQSQFPGTGLGLVTCQRIVMRHGGSLTLRSQPGEGTTARIELPLPAASAGPRLQAA